MAERKTVTLAGNTLRAIQERIDVTLGEGQHQSISISNLGLLMIQWAVTNMPISIFRDACINAKQIHDMQKQYKTPPRVHNTNLLPWNPQQLEG